jgi:hypothetical protein
MVCENAFGLAHDTPVAARPRITWSAHTRRVVGFALIGKVDAVGGAVSAALAAPPPSGARAFIVASARTRGMLRRARPIWSPERLLRSLRPPENGVEQRDVWRALRTDVHASRDQL